MLLDEYVRTKHGDVEMFVIGRPLRLHRSLQDGVSSGVALVWELASAYSAAVLLGHISGLERMVLKRPTPFVVWVSISAGLLLNVKDIG